MTTAEEASKEVEKKREDLQQAEQEAHRLKTEELKEKIKEHDEAGKALAKELENHQKGK